MIGFADLIQIYDVKGWTVQDVQVKKKKGLFRGDGGGEGSGQGKGKG